jgi:hypothetical protein
VELKKKYRNKKIFLKRFGGETKSGCNFLPGFCNGLFLVILDFLCSLLEQSDSFHENSTTQRAQMVLFHNNTTGQYVANLVVSSAACDAAPESW